MSTGWTVAAFTGRGVAGQLGQLAQRQVGRPALGAAEGTERLLLFLRGSRPRLVSQALACLLQSAAAACCVPLSLPGCRGAIALSSSSANWRWLASSFS